MTSKKLSRTFYEREGVTQISKELLGKVLCTRINGAFTSGIIVETEAYNGRTDRASHAYGNTRTQRTETMYGEAGHAYIYLCYGIHHLFNVVTNRKNVADAILIRALEPSDGMDVMRKRRGVRIKKQELTNGPGKLSQALGITTEMDGIDLKGGLIWIEDRGIRVAEHQIGEGERIGIDYAGADARLPWRYFIKESGFLSK